MSLSLPDSELVKKLGITIPNSHKYLTYIHKPLDLIFSEDNPEAFQKYQDRYPDTPIDNLLKSLLETGAAKCFTYFFETTKYKEYYFERIFVSSGVPTLGVQCPYFYSKNNAMLNTIDEVCTKLFPGKEPIDFLKDIDQIEHCINRFGTKGRTKITEKLLDKLKTPLFTANNLHVFEYIHANKAEYFSKIYLEKIEKENLVEPFILSLFSTTDLPDRKTYINFFDRFTQELYKEGNQLQNTFNSFICRNIQNGNIKQELHELILAYCIKNVKPEYFEIYYGAKPISEQSLLKTLTTISSSSLVYKQFYDCLNYGEPLRLSMENNALNALIYNKVIAHKFSDTIKELGGNELLNSMSALFCFASNDKIGSTLELFSEYIDWNYKDKNNNNISHYIINFLNKLGRNDSSYAKDFHDVFKFFYTNKLELLIEKNNLGITSGKVFIDSIKDNANLARQIKPELNEFKNVAVTIEYRTLDKELMVNEEPIKKKPKL